MVFQPLDEQSAQAYRRFVALRREVLRLRIDNARNEGILALTAAIEAALEREGGLHDQGEILAQLNEKRAAAYRRMARYAAARAVFGRRAAANLQRSGLGGEER